MQPLNSDPRIFRLSSPKASSVLQASNQFQFNLHILTVHLSVKFSCQMTLEYKDQVLQGNLASNSSSQISQGQSKVKSSLLDQQKKKFIVNNELYLQGNPPGGVYEITVNLTTGKGANYFAGVIKINQQQLLEGEGQILAFSLEKCLDPDAFCEVRVNQGDSRIMGGSKTSTIQPLTSTQPITTEARKYETNVKRVTSPTGIIKPESQRIPQTTLQTRQTRLKTENLAEIERKPSDEIIPQISQSQLTQYSGSSSIVREEANQNMKSSIPTSPKYPENQNKGIKENTLRIKQLQLEIQSLMKSRVETGPMQRIIKEKNQIIQNLEGVMKSLQHDKVSLKETNRKQEHDHQTMISEMKLELQKMREQGSNSQSVAKSIAEKGRRIISLEAEIRTLKTKLQNQGEKNKQFQKAANLKAIDSERIAQFERHNLGTTINKLNEKVRDLNSSKSEFQQTIKYLGEDLGKNRQTINDLERDNLSLAQQIRDLSNKLQQSKIYKEVSGQIQIKYKNLQIQSEKNTEMQPSESRMSSESALAEMCENGKQLEQLLEMEQSHNIELEEKCKNLTLKMLQLEKNIAILKIQEERARTENQHFRKDLDQFKIREKSLIHDIRDCEERIINLENRLEVEKQKYQLKEMKEHSLKQETLDSKSSTNKIKEAFEELQITHNSALKERDTISFQCEKLKMKMKVLQEKLESVTAEGKEKQNHALDRLSKAEKEAIGLKSKINSMISSSQVLNDQIHSKQLQNLKHQMDLQNCQRQLRQVQEKLSNSSSYSKEKETEVYQLISSNKQKELRVDHLKEDLFGSKTKYTELLAEFNASQKTNQLLESAVSQLKYEVQEKTQTIGETRKSQERTQQKLLKSETEKLSVGFQNEHLNKEYESYKKQVRQIISLIPIPSKRESSSRSINLQDSRSSVIDELDRSIIYQLPITHMSYRELDESTSLPEMKKIIVQYCDEAQRNISSLTETSRSLEFQNQRLNQELAEATQTAYKNQQNLYAKMKQFSEEIQEMGGKYTHEMKRFDDNAKKLQKDVRKKEDEIKDLNEDMQKLQQSNQQAKKHHQTTVQSLTKRLDHQLKQLKTENQQLQTTNDFLNLKNNSLIQTNAQLQKELELTKSHFEDSKSESAAKSERKLKEIAILNEQVKSLKEEIQAFKTNKLEAIRKINEVQSENNRLKDSASRNEDTISEHEKQIKNQKGRMEDIIKQKDLKSRSEFEKESKILSLSQELSNLQHDNLHMGQTGQKRDNKMAEMKETIRQISLALKQAQDQTKVTERKREDVTDRASMYERQLQQKDQYIGKLENKNLSQIQEFNQKKHQLLQALQEENQSHNRTVSDQNLEIIELQKKLQTVGNQSRKNEQRNNEVEQLLYAERHKIMQLEQMNETLTARKEELEEREEQLEAMYCDLTEETKINEEKMFGMSSKVHQFESRAKDLEKIYIQATERLNAKWEIKLKRITEECNNKISALERERNSSSPNLIMPQTHSVGKSEEDVYKIRPERDRELSPMAMHALEKQEPEERQQIGALNRSRRKDDSFKDQSHQYGVSRHLRYIDHEDLHGTHTGASTTRNTASRKEIRKYQPLYRRTQRYN